MILMANTDELLTIVRVEADTSDLDLIINSFGGTSGADPAVQEVMSGFVELASEIKNGVEKGCDLGVVDVSERLKSLQELYIGLNGSIHEGKLINSIDMVSTADNVFLVGTDIIHFYPLCVEKGRGAVRPIQYDFLHFVIDGKHIYTKYSRPTVPRPFVQPAVQTVDGEAEDIVWRDIAYAIG